MKFLLYCKSYRSDVIRVKNLLKSINEFNLDKIPFYISTPASDKNIFDHELGGIGYNWVSDESICLANPKASLSQMYALPGRLSQQIIKSEFWRLGLCDYYLCLDSDAQFIRNFTINNFFDNRGNFYTIRHQAKDFIKEMKQAGKKKYLKHYYSDCQLFKLEFNRICSDDNYDFGPSPMLWSAKVWQYLADNILILKNESIWDAIIRLPSEIRWYGEVALIYKKEVLIPIAPLFKCYHYQWQYIADQKKNVGLDILKNNFMGVLYQSNWNHNFSTIRKSFFSRLWNKIKTL